MTSALQTLNRAPRAEAAAMIAPLVERSDWVAELAVDGRPFASDEDLAEALVEQIIAAPPLRRLALFRAHPALAGREAAAGSMTEESTGEQARLGLLALRRDEAARLAALNAHYESRFGHPFIIALHRVPDITTLFARFESRLSATPIEEHTTTLAEIASVIRSRTRRAFGIAEAQDPIPSTTP